MSATGELLYTLWTGGSLNEDTISELVPDAIFGSVLTILAPCVAAQATAPSNATLYEFRAEPDAQFPGILVCDKSGVLYGAASGGGQGYGAVFSLTPPTA